MDRSNEGEWQTWNGSVEIRPGLSLRYDKPDDDLTDCVTGYHVYAAAGRLSRSLRNWFLPGTANVRLTFAGGAVAVRIGAARFDAVPELALYGPTTKALETVTNGGVMLGFGISALGWSRLTDRSAHDFQNQIVPAAVLLGDNVVDGLVHRLWASDLDGEVKPILDAVLRPLFETPSADEPIIRRLQSLLATTNGIDVAAAAARLDISQHTLRRVAMRYFGIKPKTLLMRSRFLRALLAMKLDSLSSRDAATREGYHDGSHFLKDAEKVLGMTPARFLDMPSDFLDASLKARAAVLGSPTQALPGKPQG